MSQRCPVRIYRKDGQIIIERSEDVEPTLERNKQLRNERQKSDWGRHVASIPPTIWLKWLHEEWNKGNRSITAFGEEMDRLVERKLNDPDWKYLRTDK